MERRIVIIWSIDFGKCNSEKFPYDLFPQIDDKELFTLDYYNEKYQNSGCFVDKINERR